MWRPASVLSGLGRRQWLGRRPLLVLAVLDEVIDAAGDPVITVGVAAAAVAGKILALVSREIGLLEAGVIAIDRAHHPRPRLADAEIARGFAVLHLAVGIDDLRHHAEERQRRR